MPPRTRTLALATAAPKPKKQRKAVSALEEAFADQVRGVPLSAFLHDYRREFVFHPTRGWRFDYAWPDVKVALEIEGGTWVNGAHNRGAHFQSDAEKYNEAALLGWKVLRADNHMVNDGRALAFVKRALGLDSVTSPLAGRGGE